MHHPVRVMRETRPPGEAAPCRRAVPVGWTPVGKRRRVIRFPLGFEATGPGCLLRGQLEAAAGLVFAQPLPGGVAFGPDDSYSYAEWLLRLGGD